MMNQLQEQQQPPLSEQQTVDFASFSLWHLVSDFLVLPEILTARQVCQKWDQGLCSGVSLQQCIRFLDRALLFQRNMTILHDTAEQPWSKALSDLPQKERIKKILNSRKGREKNAPPFRAMLETFRILRYVPAQMAICYNQEYGRHCLAMKWDAEKRQTEPVLYQHCQRGPGCPTCKWNLSQKPVDKKNAQQSTILSNERVSQSSKEIHQSLEEYDTHNSLKIFDSERNQDLSSDLKHFTNQCIPNIPPDLICPVCRCQDKRTLLLSGFSYCSDQTTSTDELSPLGYRTCNLLTLTPATPDHEVGTGLWQENPSAESEQEQEETSNSAKRPRLSATSVSTPTSFPPLNYQDLALPKASDEERPTQPLQPESHLKHVTAIHCTECRRFAVLAPSGLCWSSRYPCLSRSQTFGEASVTRVGGMLVRTSCSEPNCLRPVFCHNCSHASWHMPYSFENQNNNNDNNNETEGPPPLRSCMQMQHSSRCDFCDLDYCPAHAWLSTVCHHW